MRFPCAKETILKLQVMCRDGAEFKQAEEIKMCKISSTVTAKVRMDNSVLDIMRGIINFGGAFRPQYGVSFIQSSFKDVVDDRMRSSYLPTRSQFNYLWCVCLDRFLSRNDVVQSTLERLRLEEEICRN